MTGHLVVGTAGHIDHGKTALIRALTGENTDRLPEERKRGISIDLGFAHMQLADGRTLSFVDVPGHERFIKNMVAGATGIDAVMLVVASDEGIMPQTREHLDIVSLLGVESGIVVLTKIDMVWDEWLEEMRNEVSEGLAGTFLARAPMLEASSATGEGLDQVREALQQLRTGARPRDLQGPARLPIDRVFTVAGFGTVVTGTLVSGQVSVGDRLEILPRREEVRVRGLQVHGADADVVGAGQRVAVNLSGVSTGEIQRGQSLCAPGEFIAVRGFGGSLRLLEHVKKPFSTNARVRVHTATAEILGRVLLLESEQVLPGDKGYVHVRLEQPCVVAPEDRYIIRTYSPMDTIGGGKVLDVYRRYRRFDRLGIETLAMRDQGDVEGVARAILTRSGTRPLSLEEVARRLGEEINQAKAVVSQLLERGEARQLGDALVAGEGFDQLRQKTLERVREYHRQYPLREGILRPELRQAILPRSGPQVFSSLVKEMVAAGDLGEKGDHLRQAGFCPRLNSNQEREAREILGRLEQNPLEPPPVPETWSPEILRLLENRGDLVMMRDLAFSGRAVEEAERRLRDLMEGSQEGITVAGFRDLLGTSRRYALALLNYFDQAGITRRVGDLRFLRSSGRNDS